MFIYYRNTDNTGTQRVLLCFFSFNLTCMLKKSQSWGLSSSLTDERLLAWTNHGLHPLWSTLAAGIHLNRVQEVQTPGDLFKCTQTAEQCRYKRNVLPPLSLLKKKSFTFIFPWSGRSFNFGIRTQTLAGLGLLTAGATGCRLWLIILLSMGYNNGKLTSGTQHLYSVTFQVWLTELFYCILQQKTNPQRAF